MLATALVAALIGVLVGGVLNALADDLPYHRRPTLPHYPDGSPRPFSAWLGILAFLAGQRASPGGAKLGWRYPITEIATALGFALVIVATSDDTNMTTLQLAFWLIYMAIFVLVTVIDIEHKLILFAVMIPSGIIALIDAALTPVTHYGPTLSESLLGGLFGFVVSFLLYLGGFLFIRISGRLRGHSINEIAFGYGDVMMFTLSGLLLGAWSLFFSMYVTVIAGAIGAILFLATRGLRRRGYRMFTAIPYGPYIVFGTALMMLFPETVLSIFGIPR